jgi:tetratricopeptide (TPR) repeat protein
MNTRQMTAGAIPLMLLIAHLGCTRVALPPPAPTPSSTRPAEQHTTDGRKLDQVLLQFQKGITLLENNKFKEARTLFETLRESYPHVSVIHNNLGVAYKRLGLIPEAEASYRQAIQIHPSYAEAYYNLAIALRERGEFGKAEGAYQEAISKDPLFRDAHYNLGVLYDLYLNEPAKAIGHYQVYLESGGDGQEEMAIWIAALQKRTGTIEGGP